MAQVPIAKLRSQIKSVESIRKITKAQELIAAAHVIRARERLAAGSPYTHELSRILARLTAEPENAHHPLLRPHDQASRVAIIMVTTDRGQCGSYNSQIFARVDEMIQELQNMGRQPLLYVIGKRGENHCTYRDHPIVGKWPAFGLSSRYSDFGDLGRQLVDLFILGSRQWRSAHPGTGDSAPADVDGVDEIHIVHNQFISSLRSAPKDTRILPLDPPDGSNAGGGTDPDRSVGLFQYEPDPVQLLDSIGRAHTHATIHSALVEACAAEISARRIAMKIATDNADTRVDSLRLNANRTRQDQITEQVIEDSRGASPITDYDAR